MCQLSHNFKVTLQYCLWDFLREMGEVAVGGTAVIKNLNDEEMSAGEMVTGERMQNIAKAYAWWIAKHDLTMMIFKVRCYVR